MLIDLLEDTGCFVFSCAGLCPVHASSLLALCGVVCEASTSMRTSCKGQLLESEDPVRPRSCHAVIVNKLCFVSSCWNLVLLSHAHAQGSASTKPRYEMLDCRVSCAWRSGQSSGSVCVDAAGSVAESAGRGPGRASHAPSACLAAAERGHGQLRTLQVRSIFAAHMSGLFP
jgi:hypothetical protein